jgi:hypothetical protein
MKYIIRSAKYLLLLCVLILAMAWISTLQLPKEANVDFGSYLVAQYGSPRGILLLVGVLLLALLYPRFGFVSFTVEGCDIKEDGIRIDNAMHHYGFRLVSESEGVKIYRATGLIHRLTLMFEDVIEVRTSPEGVTLSGLRRPAVRIGYLLRSYMDASRFEK